MRGAHEKSPSDLLRRALIYFFSTKKQNESCSHLSADMRMMMMQFCKIHFIIFCAANVCALFSENQIKKIHNF